MNFDSVIATLWFIAYGFTKHSLLLASVSRPSLNSLYNNCGGKKKKEIGRQEKMKTRKHGEGLGNNLSDVQ